MDYTKQRNNMVEYQIKERGITDERLLDAFRKSKNFSSTIFFFMPLP